MICEIDAWKGKRQKKLMERKIKIHINEFKENYIFKWNFVI